ncbi:MAG: hypothetical protein HOH95_12505 [Dehalococcoidia bacterium]|jgi:hypothetical protein|nr:hypothetical protein [Dehalococcoidia bacterium]
MPRIDLLLTLLLAVALFAACDSSEDEPTAPPSIGMGPGISIADALASDSDQPLLVNGALVATSEAIRLCDVLMESYPPQCGSPYLTVEGLDLSTVDNLQEASGVSWTDFPFQLLGTVEDGIITVNSLTSG